MDIFLPHAPRYHAAGLPVIPLFPRDHYPATPSWNIYHDQCPPDTLMDRWVQDYPQHNLGLVLGEQSGLFALHLITPDQGLLTDIQDLLPDAPWVMTTDRGLVLAYRFDPRVAPFRVVSTDGEAFCELLGGRSYLPLPPSIQPNSGTPAAANRELLECLTEVNFLPEDVEEILRGLIEHHLQETRGVDLSHSGWSLVTDHIAPGCRDVKLAQEVGRGSWAVLRGERTLVEAADMLRSAALEHDHQAVGPPTDMRRLLRDLTAFIHRDLKEKNRVLPLGWDDGLTPEMREEMDAYFDKDQQSWTFEQTRRWLYEQIVKYNGDEEEDEQRRMDAVEETLRRIVQSGALNSLERDRLLSFIVQTADVGLKLTALRRRLRELSAGAIEGNDQTEVAEAAINDLRRTYQIRFHDDRFWFWGGSHWQELDRQVILQRLSDAYGHLPVCKRWGDMWSIVKIMAFKLEQGICEVDVPGVNFANGFLTRDLKLLDHSPDYGMTYTLPLRYLADEKAKAPRFFKFLEQIWGHCPDYRQKVDALQEAMAVTLFGAGTVYQRAILLQGLARSGKTQLLRIVTCLVPDNARSVVPPTNWNDRFTPTALYGKLLNVAGELHEYKSIDGQAFKEVIDGSERVGEFKGRDSFNFSPKATHWFASNHYPRTSDTSEGFNRRWLVLEFDKQVPPSDITRNLGDLIVAEEREAIIAWVVQGMPRIMKNRDYTLPESHIKMMGEIANLNNSVRFFITESPEVIVGPAARKALKEQPGTSAHTYESELYAEYSVFCTTVVHAKPVGARSFRAKMKELAAELGFGAQVASVGGVVSYQYTDLVLSRRLLAERRALTAVSSNPTPATGTKDRVRPLTMNSLTPSTGR